MLWLAVAYSTLLKGIAILEADVVDRRTLLDARVRDELDALPFDMRARFRRIAELIHVYGLEAMREPHIKHLRRFVMGDADEGQRRDFSRYLRHRQKSPGSGGPSVRQADPEDAAAGD